MEKTRDELIEKIRDLKNQEAIIREQIDQLDYNDRFNSANKYVGKYYKDVSSPSKDNPPIIQYFVYGINKESCELNTLLVHDFSGGNGTHFEIGYHSYFNPEKWDEETRYEEITKEEFEKNYLQTLQFIINAVKTEIKK